jgi:hypothetical protein
MLRVAARGVWEFVVGDDWRAAAGVVAALATTALAAAAGLPAWWISPIATLSILYWSVRREGGRGRRLAVRGGAAERRAAT